MLWRLLQCLIKVPRIFFLSFLKALSPFVNIRFIPIRHYRIGHLALDTEIFLRTRPKSKKKRREIDLFLTQRPVNRQLLNMIKRQRPVLESAVLFYSLKACTRDSAHWNELPVHKDEYHALNNQQPQLEFSEEEEARGIKLLSQMGIRPNQSFICFHARDKAFLDSIAPSISREGWHYHDHRDSQIKNYLLAAEHLASQGVFAVRMGAVVNTPLDVTNPKVIDYATHHRSEFGDIYLSAKCKFFLGNNSGICCVPWIFNRPSAAANWIPLCNPPLSKKSIFILKKLWHIEKKRFLTWPEIIENGAFEWSEAQEYEQAGIEVVENTGEEILELGREVNDRIDGRWKSEEEDEHLQERYCALFPPGHKGRNSPARLGVQFLRQNKMLLG